MPSDVVERVLALMDLSSMREILPSSKVYENTQIKAIAAMKLIAQTNEPVE